MSKESKNNKEGDDMLLRKKSKVANTDDKIESILSQQYPVFRYDKYPTIFLKAAMLMYFFIKGHCFVDGNKRVGIQTAITFLEINVFSDNLDDDEGIYSREISNFLI